MKKLLWAALVIVLATSVAGPAWAGDGKNRFRVCIGTSESEGDMMMIDPVDDVSDSGVSAAVFPASEIFYDPESSVGFMFGYERTLTDRLGLEVAAMYADQDIGIRERQVLYDDVTGAVTGLSGFQYLDGGMDMMPVTVGLNVHVLNSERVDLFVGPLFGYVFYGDFALRRDPSGSGLVDVDVDDDFTHGAVLGVDVPFKNRKFFFSAMARILDAEADVIVPSELTGDVPLTINMDVDPYTIDVGFGYRF